MTTVETLPPLLDYLHSHRGRLNQFMLSYEAGIEEVSTKLRILQREFSHAYAYNPIEQVCSRLKTLESLLAKAQHRDCASLDEIRREITDIAGVRVVCAFVSDVYRISALLQAQDDVRVMRVKDYIADPKANGYRSLHLIVEVPVFLSCEVVDVPVEVQFRTIAMDFWASLEHKIYYKYDEHVPAPLLARLAEAAATAARLDDEMQLLHQEIRGEVSSRTQRPRTLDGLSDQVVGHFLELLNTQGGSP